jgi:hypothetical protein
MRPCRTCALFVAVAGLSCLPGYAQTKVLQPGDVVIGQCQGHTSDPGCVLPNLFGPTGLTLDPGPNVPHYAHFSSDADSVLNRTLGSAIATQLVTLPIISPASGFTYRFDSASGGFVRSTASFGPIYAERAETIGKGKVSFGFSYQRFHFNSVDGIDLDNVPAVLTHVFVVGNPWERDVISTSNKIDLTLNQSVLYGTVGLTNRLDLSVAIPIVNVDMIATSGASIIRVSGNNPIPIGSTTPVPNPHAFDASGTQLQKTFTSNGSATGIGDVTFRLKAGFLNRQKVRVAGLLDIRAASGDAQRYLGSGAAGIRPAVVVSGGSRVSPHVNFGYQWNGSSILAGNITGVSFGTNADRQVTITNGPQSQSHLPGNLFYTLGVDIGATNRLTLAFDYLGLTVFNAPQVRSASFATQQPVAPAPASLPNIRSDRSNMGLNNGSIGAKYNIGGRLLLTGNLLFRMDNNGLRQNVTPLIALSYAFQ